MIMTNSELIDRQNCIKDTSFQIPVTDDEFLDEVYCILY